MRSAGRKPSAQGLRPLLLTASAIPVMTVCAETSWPWVCLGGLGAAAWLWFLGRLAAGRSLTAPGGNRMGKGLLAAAGILLILFAAGAGARSTHSFPETRDSLLAAWLLLLPAALAAWGGTDRAARSAGVLFWPVAVFFLVVILFTAGRIRQQWLSPAGAPADALGCLAALLLPGAGLYIEGSPPGRRTMPVLLPAAAAASVTAVGVLSAGVAAEEGAFRTLSQSVSILGVMRRFEALVSGALLMSRFCLCTLLLCSVKKIFSALFPTKQTAAWAAFLPVFALVPAAMTWREPILQILCATSCGLIPAALLTLGAKNFFRKNEKNY